MNIQPLRVMNSPGIKLVATYKVKAPLAMQEHGSQEVPVLAAVADTAYFEPSRSDLWHSVTPSAIGTANWHRNG